MRLLGLTVLICVLAMLATAVEASHRDKFELVGTATSAKDPTNSANYVIKVDNTTGFGGVRRVLNTKITTLDDHLTVRYYFVGSKTCNGGSPRIQLAIDTNGNGVSNGNAHGSIGPSPSFTACDTDVWRAEDLTISVTEGSQAHIRWSFAFDLDEDGDTDVGSGGINWDGLKLFLDAFPNHMVLRATLIEDQAVVIGTFIIFGGVTYYDNITFGYRTLEDASDVSGNN